MAIDIGMRNVFTWMFYNPWIVVIAFLAYVFLYLISIFFFGQKPGKNPFFNDYRRPAEPFVHDSKARDAIIKQKFKASKINDPLDAIVIGSGVGGLTTAVLLGRAGKKVLVLEQHDQAGGCCHSFVEKGFEFDTGIHYIGNVHEGSDNKTLLDQLTCGQLRWAKMDDAFDSVAIGHPSKAKVVPMKSGKERYIQNLIDHYPKEEKAIHEYMKLVADAAGSFMGIMVLKVVPWKISQFLIKTGLYRLLFSCWRKGYCETTLQQVLDKLTDNKELKLVLSYICGDYGVLPNQVPFLLHAILIRHYLSGGYYPAAGTSEVAFHMVQAIQNTGGRVLVNAKVSRIICNEKGRAVGVTVDGKAPMDIKAKYIISDAGVVNTFKTLLPKEIGEKSRVFPFIEKIGPSCSFITTFLGVEGNVKDLKLPAGNVWLYNSSDVNDTFNNFLALKSDEMEDAEIPFGYISFPCAKDPEWEKKYPGKSSVLVITLANWEWFKEWKDDKLRHRGDRYDGLKDVIGRRMWQQCVDLYPQLDGKLVYMEVGTPVTNQHYLFQPEGEMYGLNQDRSRFTPEATAALRCDTDVPGLYLTGQDTMTCGFSAALIMGVICAGSVLHRNCYNDLMNLKNKLYPKEKQEQKVTEAVFAPKDAELKKSE